MSYLAFEGATKKNKPSINNGDVVYAKIVTASKDMEPELVCVDAYGNKAGLGQLTGTVTNMTLKVTSMILIFQSSYKLFLTARRRGSKRTYVTSQDLFEFFSQNAFEQV